MVSEPDAAILTFPVESRRKPIYDRDGHEVGQVYKVRSKAWPRGVYRWKAMIWHHEVGWATTYPDAIDLLAAVLPGIRP